MIDPALRDVFDRAASLPPQERAEFLARACEGNDGLRREVERLLAADARLGSTLDTEPGSDPATGLIAAAAMSLQPGTRLGPYEIVAALGAGGMGEVYKARDTRLDRTVAIKVVTHDLSADPATRQRFDREARAVATLSHPNICALFDVGHQDGIDFLVMEFLDGETLASRLRRDKLSLQDALICATHVADALAAAHRAGIVHRDLKPGNIMLTASGVKLLDFGLAKRRQQPVATDGTKLTAEPLTHTGMILGTVQYMAPEQLEGRAADERTDIFAFGAVLYEMLTGRRAFEGASSAALIGNILHAQPPAPSSIERLTPRSLDDVVRRCLAKDPAARWPSIADVERQLTAARDSMVPARRKSRVRLIALAVGMLVTVVGLGWWRFTPSSSAPTPSLPLGAPVQRNLARLTFDAGLQTDPTFSPDGRFVAYAADRSGNFDIWVKPVAGGDAVQVTKSPAADMQPSWSPDGSTIVFRSERDAGGLYLVAALGGPERLVTTEGVHPSWSADGTEIRYQKVQTLSNVVAGLHAISPQGGQPHQVSPEFTAQGAWWSWIATHPDGRTSFLGYHKKHGFGFFTVSATGEVRDSRLLRHAPAELANLRHSGGQKFQWANGGRAVMLETESNSGIQNIWKAHVDPATLEWTSFERLTTGGGADFAANVATDGTRLVFSTQHVSTRLWQFAIDAQRRRLADGQPLTDDSGYLFGTDVSPDGVAAFSMARPGETPPQINLWLMPLVSRRPQLVSADALAPVWSANHRAVAYIRFREDTKDPTRVEQPSAIAVRQIGGEEEVISAWATDWLLPTDWLPDGSAVLACAGSQVMELPVTQPPASAPGRIVLKSNGASMHDAKISPNGRWLAIGITPSERTGTTQVGITPANGAADRAWRPIASDHRWVAQPRWALDGKTLYFISTGAAAVPNLWGTAFDAENGVPTGEPFQLTSFDSPALAIIRSGLNVFPGMVFMPMRTATGNVWMLDNVDR